MIREIREETGLQIRCDQLVGSVQRDSPPDAVLEIRDYAATVTGGSLVAGDDAAEARWVSPAELGSLPLTTGLAETLADWGVLG